MKYSVRSVREGDAEFLSKHLRDEDVREVWASSRRSPLQALRRASELSRSWSLVAGGEVVAMFGVGPNPQGQGVPWLLRQSDVKLSPRDIMTVSRAVLEWFLQDYTVLVNATNNRQSERWLTHLGFTLGEAFPIDHQDGEAPEVFRVFHLERSLPCATS